MNLRHGASGPDGETDMLFARTRIRRREHEPWPTWWAPAVEAWQVLRPVWWPFTVTVFICAVTYFNDQFRDLIAAMPLNSGDGAAAGLTGRFWWTVSGCAVFSFMTWVFARALLGVRFLYTPCPYDPPAWQVVLRLVVARLMGLALPLTCIATCLSLDMRLEAIVYAVVAAALFLAFSLLKTFLHTWLDDWQSDRRAQDDHAAIPANRMGRIDEALELADETLDEASREPDPERQRALIRRFGTMLEVLGRSARNVGRRASEAQLFDRQMPDAFPPTMTWLLYAILLLHLVLAVLVTWSKVAVPQALGTATICYLAAAGMLSYGAFVFTYWGRHSRIPPALAVFAVWMAFTSQFNDNHEVRTLPLEAGHGPAPTIADVAGAWLQAREADIPWPDESHTYPVVIVAAEGGGARAAYWTGTVLADLHTSTPGAGEHVFLVSGISGGALGAAAYAAAVHEGLDGDALQRRVDAFLSRDFLSPVAAGGFYVDLFSDIVPWSFPAFDRAIWLETAWSEGWRSTGGSATFELPFEALAPIGTRASPGAPPLLAFATTSVRTGELWVVSPARFADGGGCKSRDVIDLLRPKGETLSLAVAAHLSARFTIVSPAGRIAWPELGDGCGPGEFDRFVDGAYFENSGADTATRGGLVMKDAIEIFCAQKRGNGPRCDPDALPIRPVAIRTTPREPRRLPNLLHESQSVISTVFRTREARGSDALRRFAATSDVQRADILLAKSWRRSDEKMPCRAVTARREATFVAALESMVAPERDTVRRVPLGWMLSDAAAEHMCRQRARSDALIALKQVLAKAVRGRQRATAGP